MQSNRQSKDVDALHGVLAWGASYCKGRADDVKLLIVRVRDEPPQEAGIPPYL